jgi:tRNA modification GTPase
MYSEETIAAVSTPPGIGAIGIVRVSGKKAVKLVDHIFKGKNKKKLNKVTSHTVHFGSVMEPFPARENNRRSTKKHDPCARIIDDVLVTVMRAPNSYTGEDLVEISCHGGPVVLAKILDLIFTQGAKPALPGEFTKRAFLNGRLDLVQAESVCDIINAKTETSLKIAIDQLHGHLSSTLNKIKDKLVSILAILEATLDYPEEDIPTVSRKQITGDIENIKSIISGLLATAKSGKIFREGLSLAIIGKPNTGKSTLLNTLLKEDKAIVTPIPGTTRDVIEDWLNIDGVPIKIMDTAGIKTTRNPVEKIGIERTKKAIETADLVLAVIDLSSELTKEDKYIAGLIEGKKHIVVGNKMDLVPLVKEKDIQKMFSRSAYYPLIKISALKDTGIKHLHQVIHKLAPGPRTNYSESILVTNIRHKDALNRALTALENAQRACKDKVFYELIALDVRLALKAVGEVTGQIANEQILEQIFSKFCIGK